MHRTSLLNQLRNYTPGTSREAALRNDIIAFVQDSEDCLQRTNHKGHVTGSAWIIDDRKERALLLHHRKLKKWIQPGGHADGQRDLLQVAYREAREETGLKTLRPADGKIFDLDIHSIPAREEEPAHRHYDIRYLFVAESGEVPRNNHESWSVAWIPLADIRRYNASESISRMVSKTLELAPGYPG